jgi:hypothetical protein
MPFAGVKAYSTSSLHPSWYLVRSKSNVVIRHS